MTVTYEGTALQDATSILASWNLTKANYTFKVEITDTSSSLSGYVANSGVKLAAANEDASKNTTDRSTTALEVSISADSLTGTFINKVMTVSAVGSFTAALKGLDDVVQTDTDPYQITLTPVVTEN